MLGIEISPVLSQRQAAPQTTMTSVQGYASAFPRPGGSFALPIGGSFALPVGAPRISSTSPTSIVPSPVVAPRPLVMHTSPRQSAPLERQGTFHGVPHNVGASPPVTMRPINGSSSARIISHGSPQIFTVPTQNGVQHPNLRASTTALQMQLDGNKFYAVPAVPPAMVTQCGSQIRAVPSAAMGSVRRPSMISKQATGIPVAHDAITPHLWTPLEKDLFEMSEGAYNPNKMARLRRARTASGAQTGTGSHLEVRGRVSIVAPSMATRQHYHENLWRCFDAQTWPDKELIVVETFEDGGFPSTFLAEKARKDPRIVHVVMRRSPGNDFTVGLKRNMTLHLASGEFIVNFDDDDLYAPSYVESIVGKMQRENLVGVTLSAWYNYYTGRGVCTFSDPSGWGEWVNDQEELDNVLYGYGFSYSHRRQPSLLHSYPNVGFAEDAPFFLKLKELYGGNRVILWKDAEGLCVHIMHRANTAQVLGTRNVSAQDIAMLKVCDLKPFQRMIDNDFFRFSPWRPPVRLPALSIADPGTPAGSAAVPLGGSIAYSMPGGSIAYSMPGGSISYSLDAWDEEDDVKPRLRKSTLADPAEFNEAMPSTAARPRADTYRNFMPSLF